MDATAVLTVGAAVTVLTQIVKWSALPNRFAPYVVMVLALLGVGVWAVSSGSFDRTTLWDLFAGWISVTAAAAGVFGFVRGTSDSFKGLSS